MLKHPDLIMRAAGTPGGDGKTKQYSLRMESTEPCQTCHVSRLIFVLFGFRVIHREKRNDLQLPPLTRKLEQYLTDIMSYASSIQPSNLLMKHI